MERSHDWSIESEPGLTVGEKITPITSAGLFTPSGKASYPSVAYQLAVPAVVAGTFTEVTSSPGSSAVSKMPRKKSSAEISRSPLRPVAVIVAPSAFSTVG